MQPQTDVLPNILGGLTEGLVGALVGFLGAYALLRLQRSRKKIEYNVSSVPLLGYRPVTGSPLSVAVDRFALTHEEADKEVFSPVNSAYAFSINLKNTGNEVVTQPVVKVTLDSSAKIVQYETKPETGPGYEITKHEDRSKPNVLHLTIPFINRNADFLITVFSVENSGNECNVNITGPDVYPYKTTGERRIGSRFLLTGLGLGFPISVALIAYLIAGPYFFNDFLFTSLPNIFLASIILAVVLILMPIVRRHA